MLDEYDTCSCVRKSVALLPEQLLSPPYELRPEMNWIDFSGTENPLGTPATFIQAMKDALSAGELTYPPDREAHTLRSILARQFHLPIGSFLVGSSVSDMIRSVAQTYQPTSVGVAVPASVEYALAISNAGHRVVEIASPSGFITPDPSTAIHDGIPFEAAVLANPSYPTSRLLAKPTLLSYLTCCRWVIVDERSIELTLGGESMLSLVMDNPHLVIVRSLCEPFALHGVPMSYCIAHPDTIAHIKRFFDSSVVPMFAEVLGELTLAEAGHIERTREFLDSEIPWLQCMLNLIPGITIFPAEANYVMCSFDASSPMDLGVSNVHELANRLQLAGFLIRKLEGMPGLADKQYFCVAVRTRTDNEKLIEALRDIVIKH